ncbi:MAG: AMP-binding protein, partial [Planctomycetota bacterium]
MFILLLDPDADRARRVEACLRQAGHAVERVASEGAALVALARPGAADLVLLAQGEDAPPADDLLASLAASGVKKGDRVALMLPNCPQYVFSFFVTVRLGAIVTQINPMYVEREIGHILDDSGAETIIVYADVYERVKAMLPDTTLKTV